MAVQENADEDYYWLLDKDDVFHCSDDNHSSRYNPSDLFFRFPPELLNTISSHLSSQDIASLRLVSGAFEQLPRSLFRCLIKAELPWFWKLEEIDISNRDFIQRQLMKQWGENGEKLKKKDSAGRYKYGGLDPAWRNKTIDIIKGNKINVNWIKVYLYLNDTKKEFLGVRNRTRIWIS